MKSVMHDVTQFHYKFGLPCGNGRFTDEKLKALRRNLIEEECQETLDALDAGDAEGFVDGCGDLVYVLAGACISFGFDLNEVWNRIHRANMSKLDEDGLPIRRESDGKVLKPEGFVPPYHGDLVSHNLGEQ